jgi:LuxR family maltose regulon positive regulatory protein
MQRNPAILAARESNRASCMDDTEIESERNITADVFTVGNLFMTRPRVDALLSSAFEKSVTLIYGGEGCGKSCAVYSYLRGVSVRTWWIQLSEADNNPSRFWENVCNAIMQFDAKSAMVLTEMGFPGTGERFKLTYDRILDMLKPNLGYSLVFDDTHLIMDDEVKSFLFALAENPLPGVSHIFISRVATISTYDVGTSDDDFMIVEEKDLLFTKAEVAEYLEWLGFTPSLALVEEVYSASEGLSHLVNLAGKLVGKLPDATKNIRGAIRRNISRLIDEQFFGGSSGELKKFYVKLSLIDHLPRDLVYSLPDGAAMMATAMKRTSLIRYDTYMHAYHLHHVFIEFLKAREELVTDDEKRDIYKAAAKWCSDNHFKVEAMGYYEKIGDYAAIIDIGNSMNLYIDFHSGKYLLDILENADQSVFDREPEVRVLYVRTLYSLGRIDESIEKAENFIAEMESRRITKPDASALISLYNNIGLTKLIKATDTGEYDFSRYFEKADGYMNKPCMSDWTPTTVNMTIVAYACVVGNNRKGEPEKLIEEVVRTIPYAVRTMGGCLYGSDDLARSEVAYYRGDMAACERYAIQSYMKAKEKGQSYIESRALFLLLRMNLCRGRYDKISEVISYYDELVKRVDIYTEYVQQDIVLGWYYASIGETEDIAPWIKSDFMSSEQEAYITGLEDIVKLKYYFSEKKYHVLLAFLDRRPLSYGIRKFLLGRIGMAVSEAICLYNLKDRKGAREAMQKAYKLAAPNAFDMLFIEMGNHMRSLAGAMMRDKDCDIPRSWLELIRSKAATYAKRIAHVKSRYRQDTGKDGNIQLTLKEREVLHDLSQGLSRTEIAAYRGISVNTVKAMLQIIYEKLGADNSMDALRIAISNDVI